MGPCEEGQNQSQLNILTASRGEHIAHTNKWIKRCDIASILHLNIHEWNIRRYLRLPINEVTGPIIDSSNDRLDTFATFCSPKTKEDVIKMLGDQSGKRHTVFRENRGREFIKTIAVGMLCRLHLYEYEYNRFQFQYRYFRLQKSHVESIFRQPQNQRTTSCHSAERELEICKLTMQTVYKLLLKTKEYRP